LVALLLVPGITSGQEAGVLRLTVTLSDERGAAVPAARHRLLISDNPATSEPRRILTGADGRVDVTLRPGNYTVESDRPLVWLGKAFQWTQMVDVAPGRDTTLVLTAENAELVALPASDSAPGAAAADAGDVALRVAKWEQTLVAVWSPTARASGFVADARGLLATDGYAVGNATAVEVEVSPVLKVAARVLLSDAARGVAILWVDERSVRSRVPAPLPCAPAGAPPLDEGQEIVALSVPLRGPTDLAPGEVTTLGTRAVDTDLRLAFGGAGGPVFNAAGAMIGLTFVRPGEDPRRRHDVAVVRAGILCEMLSVARERMAAVTPPDADPLPLEPARPRRVATPAAHPDPAASAPPILSASEFDVALITPAMVDRALQKAGWTGGPGGRSPEAEARLGRLTDFGAWSEYFADGPPVLIVRVTPKLVEGFWKRVLREAARTQGAQLPPFKDFTTSFLRLQALCGATAIAPVHPFVLEHRVSDTRVVREGLYVFDPAAFGPHCGDVTLSLYGEKGPLQASTLAIPAAVLAQIGQDMQ
jgi:hypothetical protein